MRPQCLVHHGARVHSHRILVREQRPITLGQRFGEIVVIDKGRLVARGTVDEVLRDPNLGGWGVAAPADVRLERAVTDAGLAWRSEWA